jgi:hypothetical protein
MGIKNNLIKKVLFFRNHINSQTAMIVEYVFYTRPGFLHKGKILRMFNSIKIYFRLSENKQKKMQLRTNGMIFFELKFNLTNKTLISRNYIKLIILKLLSN